MQLAAIKMKDAREKSQKSVVGIAPTRNLISGGDFSDSDADLSSTGATGRRTGNHVLEQEAWSELLELKRQQDRAEEDRRRQAEVALLEKIAADQRKEKEELKKKITEEAVVEFKEKLAKQYAERQQLITEQRLSMRESLMEAGIPSEKIDSILEKIEFKPRGDDPGLGFDVGALARQAPPAASIDSLENGSTKVGSGGTLTGRFAWPW